MRAEWQVKDLFHGTQAMLRYLWSRDGGAGLRDRTTFRAATVRSGNGMPKGGHTAPFQRRRAGAALLSRRNQRRCGRDRLRCAVSGERHRAVAALAKGGNSPHSGRGRLRLVSWSPAQVSEESRFGGAFGAAGLNGERSRARRRNRYRAVDQGDRLRRRP